MSWDCDGNLRWMKTFGGTGSASTRNNVMQIESDSLGGLYIYGFAHAPQAAGTFYWSSDTVMSVAVGARIEYLVKYDNQGQFQWLRTPIQNSSVLAESPWLSVSPSGEVYWFALLDPGVYDNGAFTVTTRQFHAVRYHAAGGFQAAAPLDMTLPLAPNNFPVRWKYDPATQKIYGWFNHANNYGNLMIGNTTITAPNPNTSSLVLAAFNKQGQAIWSRQGSLNQSSTGSDIAFGPGGTLYLKGSSVPGAVFCGDTATNTLGTGYADWLMALDSSAHLLWSSHAATQYGPIGIQSVSYNNNTILTEGRFAGTLSWDGQVITSVGQSANSYIVRANAANGKVLQLDGLHASSTLLLTKSVLDRNGNAYISGTFIGTMSFGGANLSSVPLNSLSNLLLKFKNVTCSCNLLQPNFTIAATGFKSYQFTYSGGTPYTAISWDFGDGSPSVSGSNPTHSFAAYGTFPVCVTVTDTCGSNTMCKYVTVSITDVPTVGNSFVSVNIYPNPAKEVIRVENLPQSTIVEVIDIFGRSLKKTIAESNECSLRIGDLLPGVYLLRFTDSKGNTISQRFLKE